MEPEFWQRWLPKSHREVNMRLEQSHANSSASQRFHCSCQFLGISNTLDLFCNAVIKNKSEINIERERETLSKRWK